MATNIYAPYADPDVGIILKDPEYSNTESLDSRIFSHRTMGGNLYTYKNTTGDSRIIYNFIGVPRVKLLELLDFFQIYNSEEIKLVDFNGDEWRVFIEEESLTASMQQYSTLQNQIPEEGDFKITFIGSNSNATSNYKIFVESNLEVTESSYGPLLDAGIESNVAISSSIIMNIGITNSLESNLTLSDGVGYSISKSRSVSNIIRIGQQLRCNYIPSVGNARTLIKITQPIIPFQALGVFQ